MENHLYQRLLHPMVWATLSIVLISFNLRPAITSVGPLIGLIRDDLQLTNSQAGVLTTLPLLAFAGLSIAAPKLARKWGIEWTIFAGLLTLLFGILLRLGGYQTTLFMGTAIVGTGIAICNVLLPAFVKLKFEKHIGVMTSVYTTSMSLFATIGSGVSIPIAVQVGLDWQGALAVWGVVALVAIGIWTTQLRGAQKPKVSRSDVVVQKLWHSPLAWHVTVFMGLHSLIFYSLITWLPEIVQAKGLHATTAGGILSFTLLCGLPANFMTPILASRMQNQRLIVLYITLFFLIGFIGLLFVGTSLLLHFVFTFLIGLSMGASISLSMILFNLRTTSASQASQLSGMAQSIGYLLAAGFPLLLGYFYDYTNEWVLSLIILIAVSFLLMIVGWQAAQDTYVFAQRSVRK